MSYYSDLRFIGGSMTPDCGHCIIDNRFDQFYSIQLDLEGEITFAIDHGTEEILATPLIYLLHPDHHYRYGPTPGSRTWNHCWVGFTGERARRIFEEGFMPLAPDGYLPLAHPRDFAEEFSRMVEAMTDPERHHLAVHSLEALLCQLMDDGGLWGRGEGSSAAYLELADRIQASPFQPWNFPKEAEALYTSYSNFRRQFRTATALPPHEFLQRSRMRAVAEELKRSHGPVKEIAGLFGYTDLPAFSRLFKEQMGLSPRHYLKALALGGAQSRRPLV